MATADIWIYRQTAWTQNDLSGFSVEAIDGSIGKVDEASNRVGSSYVVVDTGPRARAFTWLAVRLSA